MKEVQIKQKTRRRRRRRRSVPISEHSINLEKTPLKTGSLVAARPLSVNEERRRKDPSGSWVVEI